MNAEFYLLGNNRNNKAVLKGISDIAEALKSQNIKIAYTTELNDNRGKIVEAVKQSVSPNENIDIIVIPNAVSVSANDSVIFRTICGLTAQYSTPEKDALNRLRQAENADTYDNSDLRSDNRNFANGIKINGTNSYCFFIDGKRIILLEENEKGSLASIAVPAITKAMELSPVKNIEIDGIAFACDTSEIEVNVKNAGKPISVPKENNKTKATEKEEKLINDGQAISEEDLIVAKEVSADGNVKSKKKRQNWFVSRFVPVKSDDGKEKFRKVVLDIALIVFIVVGAILINVCIIQPWLNNQKYDELRDIFNKPSITDSTDENGNVVKKESRNWKGLLDINSDIIGWIKIDNTVIDYPVLYNKDDNDDYQYYLYKDFHKNYSGYGSIFCDYRSNKAAKSKNVILHGHHMNDGSMFQNLMKYGTMSGDLDFYKSTPTIRFDTPAGDAEYKIISVFKTNTLDGHGDFFNYLIGSFESDAEFMNYVHLVRERSLIDTPVTVNENDQLLTLSTCSYEYSEFRTVVVARKVRNGESNKVDVKKAELNPNPVWPDVYYGGNLSAKPKVTTFSKAYKAGDISWYDGKGNLKGKERMFTLHDDDPIEPTSATERVSSDRDEGRNQSQANDPQQSETQRQNVVDNNIYFDYSSMTMNIGDKETLTVRWDPSDTDDKSIVWRTTNSNVATIAAGGKVTAKGAGSCTITAESPQGNIASCEITVNKKVIPVEKLSINTAFVTIREGKGYRLKATVFPATADNQTVNWSSDDESVATVDSNGRVTGNSAGTTYVRAEIEGIELACKVTVTANENNTSALE